MEWFDLIDEIIVTTLTVPLYFLLKPGKTTSKKNGIILLISFAIYLIFTLIMSIYVGNIAEYMNAEYATRYLFLQNISLLIGFVGTFMIMLFTINNRDKMIAILVISKIILLIFFDIVLIPKFKDAGASYSEIIVNLLIAIIALIIGFKNNIIALGKTKLDFIKDWIRIGVFSGVSIFLDNFIYAIMICKMVNKVSESGNYWIANNFIWGWLLVPVTCMVEIIKKNDLKKLDIKNAWRYAAGIILIWLITMPF